LIEQTDRDVQVEVDALDALLGMLQQALMDAIETG
jgi:hypothetical protein